MSTEKLTSVMWGEQSEPHVWNHFSNYRISTDPAAQSNLIKARCMNSSSHVLLFASTKCYRGAALLFAKRSYSNPSALNVMGLCAAQYGDEDGGSYGYGSGDGGSTLSPLVGRGTELFIGSLGNVGTDCDCPSDVEYVCGVHQTDGTQSANPVTI